MSRATFHHGDLRNALIDAGVALLHVQPTEALTLREVARRAGVSHAAPYRHFADKQALLTAIAVQGFELLHGRLAAVAARPWPTHAQRLKAVALEYVDFGRSHPHQTALMFGALASTKPPELEQAALTSFGAVVALVEAALQDLPSGGAPAPDAAPQAALALWAQAHGFVMLSTHVDVGAMVNDDDAHAIDMAISLTVEALLRRPSPDRPASVKRTAARK